MLNRRNFVGGLAGSFTAATSAQSAEQHDQQREASAVIKHFEVTPAIHPELRAHGAIFERKIHKVGDNVHSAIGWANGGTVMVVGDDGVIIVDTGPDIRSAREVAAEFRKITDKPVRAVIYTAFHVDHINGVKAFASAEDVKAGHVAIIAQEKLLANVIRSSATIGPILLARTIYNFGYGLAGADIEGMNNGNGPLSPPILEPPTFIAPTMTFQSKLDITIAGVTMNLVHVPSSADDQIAIFLPQHKILLSSELIPAQHFPTLYTLRGETCRDPVDWYRSIDVLRRFGAVAIVPSKMPPVIGEDKVEEVMRNYRDAIQFVHDQTIRQMNKGLTPDEMVEVVKLPAHLANYKPWMQEFFGTASQSVRSIYQGYLGWFEGDPVSLASTPRIERARRDVQLMGGRDQVLAAASKAFEDGDPQWAAELVTRLIRLDHDDTAARGLKAAAFRKLGYAQINAIWRNWYLLAARELEGSGLTALPRSAPPDFVTALPARTFVEALPTRLKAEETLDIDISVGFRFPDSQETYGIELHRGVARFVESLPNKVDLMLTLDKATLDRIRLGRLTMREGMLSGEVRVSDNLLAEAERFFSYFEVPSGTPIRLVVR
jgi:alkyl sulfatase BDS1-like metallo-beta-lactamase superfamily hydrolase